MFDVTCLDSFGNVVNAFTQWDINQTLYIEDSGFDNAPIFHFCNQKSEKALCVHSEFNSNHVLTVKVPNQLLIEPYPIIVYVYMGAGDSFKTVEYMRFPLRTRPQPHDFEFSENVEVVWLKDLIKEVKELNENVTEAENERIQHETIRISNENTRIANENARKTAETNRANAESVRVTNENARKTAETGRVNAENTRVANENARKTAETNRQNAESERATAENTRITNENTRKTAETDRQNAESTRTTNENARKDAESARVTAENTRATNENARKTAETNRQNAESTRSSNEQSRIENENARKTAETEREKAEQKREKDAYEVIDFMNEAKEGLIQATEDAIANAAESATKAKQSETNAATSANTATQKANAAGNSASSAATSAENAKKSETASGNSANTASQKATEASNYATEAESFAHGGTGTRSGEDTDNAKKYYEQAKAISESISGTLRPMGTVAFASLPALSAASSGDMYNISDAFTTTMDFKEGIGYSIPAGANVYKTADGKWDILAGTPVTGVKGNSESTYRTGNVNITPANIGLGNVPNFPGDRFSLRDLGKLVSMTQLNYAGWYTFYNGIDENFANEGLSNDAKFTDWAQGDFKCLLITTNTTLSDGTAGCRYGTLIVTSPRWRDRFWVGNIWEGKFRSWMKVALSGDVVLKTYRSLSSTGLSLSDDLGTVYSNIPYNSVIFIELYETTEIDSSWNIPESLFGVLSIYRFTNGRGWLEYHVRNTGSVYVMGLNSGTDYTPTGIWMKMMNQNDVSNENIVDNSDFSINRHGKTSYTGATGYSVDRWRYTGNPIITVLSDGIKLERNSSSSGSYCDLVQGIYNWEKYIGKTLTASLEVSGLSLASGAIARLIIFDGVGGKNVNITGNGVFSVTCQISSTAQYVNVYLRIMDGTGSMSIKWVKLEVGSIATPYTPPDPALEWDKCIRYNGGTLIEGYLPASKLQTVRAIDGVNFDGSADITHYATCSTAAATAAKVAALTGFVLATGAVIRVKFTITNTAANPTLNVNGTGAKPIYYRGAAISAGYLAANRIYEFVYDGTNYELVGDINTDANTIYSNMTGASASAAGKAGLVPAPAAGAQAKYLRGDGTWQTPPTTDSTKLPLAGGTMTGVINSSIVTSSFLAGNQGTAIINSTAAVNQYVMLDKLNSTNGYFTDGVWQTKRLFQYTAKTTVNANTNAVTKTVILLDESGNSEFPGTVTFSKTTDLSGTANNSPALIIGGTVNQQHIEIDGNEIQSKSNATTPAPLNINLDGGAVEFGGVIMVRAQLNLFDGKNWRVPLRVVDDGDDANNGSELFVYGGGNSFIGSGESPSLLYGALQAEVAAGEIYNPIAEHLYLSSDGNVYIYSNVNNIANRKGIVFDIDGFLRPLVDQQMNIGSSSKSYARMFARNFYSSCAGQNYAQLNIPTIGTATAVGSGRLTLGNDLASGTDKNAKGQILIYHENTNYTVINPSAATANVSLTLPSAGGTLARTADNVASASKLQTARKINGTNFDGTADITTANWGTARTIGVTGDVVGSVSIDGSANKNITAVRRGCTVSYEGDTVTKPWYKVASLTTSTKGIQYQITFKVNTGNSTIHGYGGILTIGFVTGSSSDAVLSISHKKCEWEYADSSIVSTYFALIWRKNSDSTFTVELWVKITSPYLAYHFEVLSEQASRITRGTSVWTLYTTKTNGSEENPIVDPTKVLYSTFARIKNPILEASTTQSGMVTTGTQSFAGAKTFTGAVTMNSTVRAANNGRMVSVQSSAPSDTGMLWAF